MGGWLAGLKTERSARWLRAGVLAGTALVLLAGFIVLAYKLTAQRVPAHRAALERLVRAETGLDLRFDALGLRWGWYGPEAVFSRVELGEPQQAKVLLRAPELIVGFNLWASLHTGHLQAGRITLVAPDIDLPQPRSAAAGAGATSSPATVSIPAARILSRWRGGRIDFEGGTLHIADPQRNEDPLVVSIRRASVYRSDDRWRAAALVLLPEHLGSTARIDLRLHGDLLDPRSLSGSVAVEGVRLVFAGWRELFADSPAVARRLPSAGGGDVSLKGEFSAGVLTQAQGSVRAAGVQFIDAPSFERRLVLDRLRGDWRLRRRGGGWHALVNDFEVGSPQAAGLAYSARVEIGLQGSRVRLAASTLPAQSLSALAAYLLPDIDLAGVQVAGVARDLAVDWDGDRPAGERLQASVRVEDLALAPASQAFLLTGLSARVAARDDSFAVALRGNAVRLQMGVSATRSLSDLQVAGDFAAQRAAGAWRIETRDLNVAQERAHLRLNGSFVAQPGARARRIELTGVLADADVATLQQVFGAELIERFGIAAPRLRAGRIEEARFAVNAAGACSGTLALKDASLWGDSGLDAQAIDADVEWNDKGFKAQVDAARVGPLQLGTTRLEWSLDARRPVRIAGHAVAHLERTLAWLRAHEELQQYVPEIHGLAARGDALFDFDFALPATSDALHPAARKLPHSRIAVLLDAATVETGPGMPALAAVRGALAFDNGHLQRSMLTGRWLGGPVTLRLAESASHHASSIQVRAQGLMDVRELAALGTFADPAALSGLADWSGEFLLEPDSALHPAQWQARLDANLTAVASRLPEPLTKAAGIAAPLHIDISGTSAHAQLRLALADRLHSVFEMVGAGDDAWRVERGSVRFGGMGPVALAAEPAVVLSGKLARLEPSPYVAAWNRAGRDVLLPRVSGAVFVSELLSAGNVYADANLEVRPSSPGLDLKIESLASGLRPGT